MRYHYNPQSLRGLAIFFAALLAAANPVTFVLMLPVLFFLFRGFFRHRKAAKAAYERLAEDAEMARFARRAKAWGQ